MGQCSPPLILPADDPRPGIRRNCANIAFGNHMRAAALICLIPTVLVPLLLSGQTFTNSLIGIAFASTSVALFVASERKARSIREITWYGRIITGLGVLLSFMLLVQLPSAYTFQSNFNRPLEEKIRQKRTALQSTLSEPAMNEKGKDSSAPG